MNSRTSREIRMQRDSNDLLISVADSPEETYREMASFVTRTIADKAERSSERFSLALSGGNSPRGLHQALSLGAAASSVDWRRVDFFWGDERCVPPDHPESNYRMARETLFEPLGIRDDQVFRIPAELGPEAGAVTYERDLLRHFGFPTRRPRLDLIILGMGSDGHTASLFPRNFGVRERDRLVLPVIFDLPKLSRISFSLPLINSAANISFLITGDDKSRPLREILCTNPEEPLLPARLVAPLNGQLHFFVDSSAASSIA